MSLVVLDRIVIQVALFSGNGVVVGDAHCVSKVQQLKSEQNKVLSRTLITKNLRLFNLRPSNFKQKRKKFVQLSEN